MTITELIERLERIHKEEGDLDVFDAHFQDDPRVGVEENESDGRFPKDWNMPRKFVQIGSEL